jgi:hypothetical protein
MPLAPALNAPSPCPAGGGFWSWGTTALVHGLHHLLPQLLPLTEGLLGGAVLAFGARAYLHDGSSSSPGSADSPGVVHQVLAVLACLVLVLMFLPGAGDGSSGRGEGRKYRRKTGAGAVHGDDKDALLKAETVKGATGGCGV